MNRRSFFIGAAVSLIAAPAIVRVASIMPVRAPLLDLTHANLQQLYTKLLRQMLDDMPTLSATGSAWTKVSYNRNAALGVLIKSINPIMDGVYERRKAEWEKVFA